MEEEKEKPLNRTITSQGRRRRGRGVYKMSVWLFVLFFYNSDYKKERDFAARGYERLYILTSLSFVSCLGEFPGVFSILYDKISIYLRGRVIAQVYQQSLVQFHFIFLTEKSSIQNEWSNNYAKSFFSCFRLCLCTCLSNSISVKRDASYIMATYG